jgi:ssDNA-binding Zn-finger/Zn-ribbon topoisomerase 1
MAARQHALACYCGAPMELKSGPYGSFYACTKWPACDGKIGAHPSGAPLGVPGNAATRAARKRAHAEFDRLWRETPLSRNNAYRDIGRFLPHDCPRHIAECNEAQCEQWIAASKQLDAEVRLLLASGTVDMRYFSG